MKPDPRPSDRPISRAGCVLIAAAWLAVTAVSCLALTLAMRGELAWRRGEFVEDRLWLVNEAEARGLGYSAARVISDQSATDGPVCVRTRVRFWLWTGTGEPVEFCECYALAPSGSYESRGNCP